MNVRAKFVLTEETRNGYSSGRKLKFSAQYDANVAEDQRFSAATPSGTVEMYVDNPNVFDLFVPGKAYYFDITEVPAPTEHDSSGSASG